MKMHGPIASKLSGLRRYIQNVVSHPSPDREADYDGVAEMWFDDIECMRKAFATTEGQIIREDLRNFTSKHTSLFANEHVVLTTF